MLGVNSTYYLPINNFINMGGTYLPAVAYVTSSDWSNAQTITIGEISASPTPTPTVPEFPSFTIPLLLSLMVVVAGLLVYRKEHSRKAE
jgi:hypothetical protein